MIAILTTNTQFTVEKVLDWLFYYKQNPIVITPEKINQIQDMQPKERDEYLEYIQKNVTVLWKWRWHTPVYGKIHLTDKKLESQIKERLNTESRVFANYVIELMNNAKYLNSFEQVNKWAVLKIAKQVGLSIPDTFFVSTKEDIEYVFSLHSKVITKPFSDNEFFRDNGSTYCTYTTLLTKGDRLPSSFPLSVVQEYIEVEYEIRTFFLAGKFYSMAILSTQDDHPIDYRQNNYSACMRHVPFTIPSDLKTQLCLLMKHLKLETGSIDLIYGKDQKYYFLEVNPIGQFSMLSDMCNYNLEKKVAQRLIDYTN